MLAAHPLKTHSKFAYHRDFGTPSLPTHRIKVRPDKPQQFEDIRFRNITLSGDGAIFEARPWTQLFDLQGQPLPESVPRGVTVSELHGSFGAFREKTITDITMKNIKLILKNQKVELGNVSDLRIENVTVNGNSFSSPTQK